MVQSEMMASGGQLNFLGSSCIILTLLTQCLIAERELDITYNEQCDIPECSHPQDDDVPNLVHITAEGDNDTIHYLWSSIGAPTVLLARTTLEAELVVSWKDLLADTKTGSISFKPEESVLYVCGLMLTRLIEYNDTKDDGLMKPKDELMTTELDMLKWQNGTVDYKNFGALLNSSLGELGDYGTISLSLMAFGGSGTMTRLPHLQHTENSTQLDLTIQHLTSSFPNSRFALEMMVVGRDNRSGQVNLQEVTSIDDEYTPAVFSTLNVRVPDSSVGSYVQWKPVSYTLTDRAMENSRHVYEYKLGTDERQLNMPNTSIAHAYFPPDVMSQVGALNISFGITNDGFFKKTNYTSWSATIGYGDPPQEFMTLTVYIVISASLGIPLLIVVFGGAGVCISKHKERKKAAALQCS